MHVDSSVRRRAVLALADPTLAEHIRQLLAGIDMDVVGVARNGPHALDMLGRTLTDLLIVDMVLPVLDAPELIRRIRALSLHTMPAVIVTTPAPMPTFERRAMELGACAVIRRPLDGARLTSLALGFTVHDRLRRSTADEGHAQAALQRLGFSLKLRGTGYLSYAIELASQDARLLENLKGALYPLVATHFSVDSGKVEHAMRRAIEAAWSGGALEMQHVAFGNTIDARRGKPTSGEMIARVAELLRVKEKESR